MIKNLVSIVMPAFNSRDFLVEAIDSVLAQTYRNWELIIVDDCSTDGTVDIALQFANQDNRIRFFSMHHNSGPAIARNKAIDEARGQYIAFLDSDDIWLPTKLEVQIRLMQQRKALFCFSSYIPVRVDGYLLPAVNVPDTVSYRQMLRGSVIGCLTVVYDASVIGKRHFSEGRNEVIGTIYSLLIEKIGHEDYILWLNILKDCDAGLYPGWMVLGVTESLAFYRLRNNSFSASKKKVALYQWIIYRRCEQIGLVRSLFYFVCYVIKGIMKHSKVGLNKKDCVI